VVALRRRRAVVPSFAKLNLGLEVLRRRDDGYHELRTVFQTIDVKDELELTLGGGRVSVGSDHPDVPADARNLAHRAAQALRRRAGVSEGVHIQIRKRIPVGAGLGGGSSNAAAVLLALDRLWRLGLGINGLYPLARRIGADVPFFLFGGTALGLARGDEIYPLRTQIRTHVVLVDPKRPIATAAVFARHATELTPRENGYNIYRFVSSDLEGQASFRFLTNDLEKAALEEAPELGERTALIRALLDRSGARHVSMSGSGSSFYGLFDDKAAASRACAALREAGLAALLSRTVTLDQYRKTMERAVRGRVAAGQALGKPAAGS
jgi:4-diphosphocytidyl-2-C-methyl-D-erythritol kinase